MDHRRDFAWLVMERYGKGEAAKVEWSAPRLICIAGDFTRYDEHAVKQISRNIELIRDRRFNDDLLLLDLVTTTANTAATRPESVIEDTSVDPSASLNSVRYKSVTEYLADADTELTDLFESTRAFLRAIGDDAGADAEELFCIYSSEKFRLCGI